ncbi:MAG TPA: DUF1700 domain-containing protein [Syntrophomonadaceae bacterium]|nr:DUF1700 domain-containing protein [Syntrophomonadaceae bacterium]
MNKSDFLQNLAGLLQGLPPDIRENVINHYDELISAAIAEGQNEKEIVTQIGVPKSIANYHVAEYLLETAQRNLTTPNFLKVVVATMRLGISNFALLIFPLLGIAGAYIALVGMSFAALIAAISLLIGQFVKPFAFLSVKVPIFFYESTVVSIATFFLAIGLIAFGLLFLIGTYILLRIFYHGTLRHLRFHLFSQNIVSEHIFPHISFKKAVGTLTLIIFICFTLTVLCLIFGGDTWFSI